MKANEFKVDIIMPLRKVKGVLKLDYSWLWVKSHEGDIHYLPLTTIGPISLVKDSKISNFIAGVISLSLSLHFLTLIVLYNTELTRIASSIMTLFAVMLAVIGTYELLNWFFGRGYRLILGNSFIIESKDREYLVTILNTILERQEELMNCALDTIDAYIQELLDDKTNNVSKNEKRIEII